MNWNWSNELREWHGLAILVYDIRYAQINYTFKGHGFNETESLIEYVGLSSKWFVRIVFVIKIHILLNELVARFVIHIASSHSMGACITLALMVVIGWWRDCPIEKEGDFFLRFCVCALRAFLKVIYFLNDIDNF